MIDRHILTIQGGMAVGKTTALRALVDEFPACHFDHEKPEPIVAKRNALRLDITKRDDFVDNQRLFIGAECERYDALPSGQTVLDRGPEDVEFYTLMFPRSINEQWPIDERLGPDLRALRARRSDRILFLRASADSLRRRQESDPSRRRGSFEHYISALYPLEEEWFSSLPYTDIVNVDGLSPVEAKELISDWIRRNSVQPTTASTTTNESAGGGSI